MNKIEMIKTGAMLLASPSMADPNFRKGVVLLCEHSEEGSFGLILNRPLEVEGSPLEDELEGYANGLSFGGPVQPNTLHFIHQLFDDLPDAEPIAKGIYWGGDFERLKEIASDGDVANAKLRFFLGYTGWGAGQLEFEVTQNDWIVVESDEAFVFQQDPRKLWTSIMKKLGGDFELFANYPLDPRMN